MVNTVVFFTKIYQFSQAKRISKQIIMIERNELPVKKLKYSFAGLLFLKRFVS